MAKAVGRDRGIWGNDLIRPARAEWKLSERSGAGGEVRGRSVGWNARDSETQRPSDPATRGAVRVPTNGQGRR